MKKIRKNEKSFIDDSNKYLNRKKWKNDKEKFNFFYGKFWRKLPWRVKGSIICKILETL